jgi:hypothetical protein
VLLAVAPWTSWWERNLFAHLLPDLSPWMSNGIVRVAVSAVGVLTVSSGLLDLRARRPGHRRQRDAAPVASVHRDS